MKHLLAALPIASLMVVPAMAQSQWIELDDRADVAAFGSTADQVEDWDVYDAAGQKLGEIEAVLGADANTATALVVDFDDAAAYIDGDVIVPIDSFTWQDNRLSLTIDQAGVQQLELWND